jgi:hypothetical protein
MNVKIILVTNLSVSVRFQTIHIESVRLASKVYTHIRKHLPFLFGDTTLRLTFIIDQQCSTS